MDKRIYILDSNRGLDCIILSLFIRFTSNYSVYIAWSSQNLCTIRDTIYPLKELNYTRNFLICLRIRRVITIYIIIRITKRDKPKPFISDACSRLWLLSHKSHEKNFLVLQIIRVCQIFLKGCFPKLYRLCILILNLDSCQRLWWYRLTLNNWVIVRQMLLNPCILNRVPTWKYRLVSY